MTTLRTEILWPPRSRGIALQSAPESVKEQVKNLVWLQARQAVEWSMYVRSDLWVRHG